MSEPKLLAATHEPRLAFCSLRSSVRHGERKPSASAGQRQDAPPYPALHPLRYALRCHNSLKHNLLQQFRTHDFADFNAFFRKLLCRLFP